MMFLSSSWVRKCGDGSAQQRPELTIDSHSVWMWNRGLDAKRTIETSAESLYPSLVGAGAGSDEERAERSQVRGLRSETRRNRSNCDPFGSAALGMSLFRVGLRPRFDWTCGTACSTFDVPMAETSTAVIASANNLSVKYGTGCPRRRDNCVYRGRTHRTRRPQRVGQIDLPPDRSRRGATRLQELGHT